MSFIAFGLLVLYCSVYFYGGVASRHTTGVNHPNTNETFKGSVSMITDTNLTAALSL